jgi:hypothetical protein
MIREYEAVKKLYLQGKTEGLREKPIPMPNATLSTTNPTCTALGMNLGHHGFHTIHYMCDVIQNMYVCVSAY